MTNTLHPDSPYRSISYWHDTLHGSLEPHSALEGDVQADVVIVGAGYTGLWTAYYLKQLDPSLNISILEAEIAGFGAAGRNGGWCSAYLSGMEYWLDRPDTQADAIRLQRLMFDAVEEVGRIAAKEAFDCHFEQSGTLEIAVNSGQLRRLNAELKYWRKLGFGEEDYRRLDQQEMTDTLNVDRALAAIHMSHTAAVHPARLARGLAATLVSSGVSLYEKKSGNRYRQWLCKHSNGAGEGPKGHHCH